MPISAVYREAAPQYLILSERVTHSQAARDIVHDEANSAHSWRFYTAIMVRGLFDTLPLLNGAV